MPRRTLLSATGLSPQVTETLSSLAVAAAGEPFVPDEVYVVTTTRGATRGAEAVQLLFIDERANHRVPGERGGVTTSPPRSYGLYGAYPMLGAGYGC